MSRIENLSISIIMVLFLVCLAQAQGVTLTMTNPYPDIEKAPLDKIKIGTTTENEVIALLGNPGANKEVSQDGTKVYRYFYKKTKQVSPTVSMVANVPVEIVFGSNCKVTGVAVDLYRPKAKAPETVPRGK